jgi:hypothetical protein
MHENRQTPHEMSNGAPQQTVGIIVGRAILRSGRGGSAIERMEVPSMKIALFGAVAVVLSLPMPASADMLERQAGRAIRAAGHWCERVTHMAVLEPYSTPQRRIVRVTCDDGTRYVQYDLVLGSDNRVSEIVKL